MGVGDRLGEPPHRGDPAFGELGRVAGEVAVHPDRAQPHPRGGKDVVYPAVRDVDPVRRRRFRQFFESAEVAEVWLVAADLLRRHHQIERNGQFRCRAGEQVLVAVGEDREPPARRGERVQRRAGVGEHRHPRPRLDEGPGGRGVERHARVPRGLAQPGGQHLPVGKVRGRGLEHEFCLLIGGQQGGGAVARDRFQCRSQARVPVRDRSVAVEGKPPVVGHRNLLSNLRINLAVGARVYGNCCEEADDG
jgi:hypothetical protein